MSPVQREREDDIRNHRARRADEQDGAASVAVGKFSPDGRENKLHRRIRREDEAELPAGRAKIPAEHRRERHDDAEAHEVNEDREKNDEDGGFAIHQQ